MNDKTSSEMWKNIEGYEGLYEVSTNGEVRRMRYIGKNRDSKYKKPKILKQKTTKKGYKQLTLCKDGEKKSFQVHRLVAETFLKKDECRDQVNHMDGCKANNNLSNLEWMTQGENIKHSYDKGFRQPTKHWEGKRGSEHPQSKQVVVLDKGNKFIKMFESILQCRDWLRETVNPKATDSHIVSCCKGERNEHCGYKYKYGSDYYQ